MKKILLIVSCFLIIVLWGIGFVGAVKMKFIDKVNIRHYCDGTPLETGSIDVKRSDQEINLKLPAAKEYCVVVQNIKALNMEFDKVAVFKEDENGKRLKENITSIQVYRLEDKAHELKIVASPKENGEARISVFVPRGVRKTFSEDRDVLYREALFRRFIAASASDEHAEFKVSLHKLLSLVEMQELLGADMTATVSKALVYVPTTGGLRTPIYLKNGLKEEDVVKELLVSKDLFVGMSPTSMFGPTDENEITIDQEIQHSIDNKTFQIIGVQVGSTLPAMHEWWLRHQDSVRFVQPVQHSIDQTWQIFSPRQEVP